MEGRGESMCVWMSSVCVCVCGEGVVNGSGSSWVELTKEEEQSGVHTQSKKGQEEEARGKQARTASWVCERTRRRGDREGNLKAKQQRGDGGPEHTQMRG